MSRAASPIPSVVGDGALSAVEARSLVEDAVRAVTGVLRGHPDVVRMLFAAVLARGHVLLEDVPGVGKTTLARAVARVLGDPRLREAKSANDAPAGRKLAGLGGARHSFSRIQFTADMLPADVLGVQVLDAEHSDFTFRPGPIFSQVVLADEINRASPKTQSAMLEAMSEGAVTIDEQTYQLPAPFLVVATQNPVEHHGAYPLPESQLDRFAVGLSLGYPSRDDERELLLAPHAPQNALDDLESVLHAARVCAVQAHVDAVTLSAPVADYLLNLVEGTRTHPDVMLGCSPRGAIVYGSLVRARAFMEGREFALPDDVKALANAVLAHRIVVASQRSNSRAAAHAVIDELLGRTPVPR